MDKWSRWTADEIERLRRDYGKVPLGTLVPMFPGRTTVAVMQKAKSLGLRGDKAAMMRLANTHYTYNRRYFVGDDLAVSYWAGFIAADGSIDDRGASATLSLAIQESDRAHLERFSEAVGYTGTIKASLRKNGSRQSVLRLHSARAMADDLRDRYNITPRKSLSLRPPTGLSGDHALAFVAGYTDGDGCIRMNRGKWPAVSFVGTEAMLCWIADTIGALPGVASTSRPRPNGVAHSYDYQVNGLTALALARHVRAFGLPLLERKWSVLPLQDD